MNSSKYAFLSHDETRRNATEEKLFGFQIEEGEKALVTALCDAMGEKFRLDRIDRLLILEIGKNWLPQMKSRISTSGIELEKNWINSGWPSWRNCK